MTTLPTTRPDGHTLDSHLPVFVYGTLRTNEGNWSWALAGKTLTETPAVLDNAAMYDNGGFPFVTPENGSRVVGDLMVINPDIYREVMTSLDSLEGFHPNGVHNLYDRHIVEVTTQDGEKVTAFTYFASPRLLPRVRTMPRIEDGNWLTRTPISRW